MSAHVSKGGANPESVIGGSGHPRSLVAVRNHSWNACVATVRT